LYFLITRTVIECGQHSQCFAAVMLLLAKSKLYWLSRHMSRWSTMSFNFAILINLAVALFYPFESNTAGTSMHFLQAFNSYWFIKQFILHNAMLARYTILYTTI